MATVRELATLAGGTRGEFFKRDELLYRMDTMGKRRGDGD